MELSANYTASASPIPVAPAGLSPVAPGAGAPSKIDGLRMTADILRLNDCTSLAQIEAALQQISAALGFDGFLFGARYQTGGTRFVERVMTNHSAAWREAYERQELVHADPTFAYARASLSPLVWSEDMYAEPAQRAYGCAARAHGLEEGATFPVHGRNGDVGRLNLSLARSGPAARSHVRAMLMWGALLATMTHEATGRVVRRVSVASVPALTRRETEVLKWIAAGKSNWEIARLVAISEHGVSHHVRKVLHKFEVGCRHQAVAKAVAFGMLQK